MLRPYRVPADTTLTLAFVDDVAMRALNRRFRSYDRTTDVLSFGQPLPHQTKGAEAARALRRDVDGALDLGDVVISGAQATRQARRARRTLASEVAALSAHGALHLLGFEDDSAAGRREMLALARAALARSPAVRTAKP